MGAPELPNDPGEEDLRTADIVHNVPTDDSDNDSLLDVAYDGYQPLAMEDNPTGHGYIRANNDDDEDNYYNNREEEFNRIHSEIEPVHEVRNDHNIPQIQAADAEVERDVWSQPRPQELQIQLDSNKTKQILNAMANFQLPNLAVPDWAEGVPEELWKEELLQRIRQRKSLGDITKMELDKDS